jgi:hypothetical protein
LQDEEAPSIMLMYQDKTFAFAGICYERLDNGNGNGNAVSVQRYFTKAIGGKTQ